MRDSRRKVRSRTAVAVVAGLLAAACGSNGTDAPTAGPTQPAPSPTGEETTEPDDGEPEGLYLDGEFVIPQDMLDEARSGPNGVWYTSINEAVSQPILDEFFDQTGIRIDLVRANPNIINERILTEAGAGVLSMDVVAMTDVFVPEYANRGIVVPYVVEAIDELDERFYAEDHSYYSLYTSPILLTYNHAVLPEDQVPTSWAALAEPGRFPCGHGWLPADGGATAWTLAMFTRQVLGEDFWQNHAAADPVIYTGGSTLAQDLGRGEICISPNTGTTTGATIESGAPVSFIIPDEGIPVFDVFIGVSDTGPNPAAGRAFMNWAMSRAGMTVAAPGYGARTDVPTPTVGPGPEHVLPPVNEAPFWKPDPDEYAELRDQWTEEWYEIYGYVPTG